MQLFNQINLDTCVYWGMRLRYIRGINWEEARQQHRERRPEVVRSSP